MNRNAYQIAGSRSGRFSAIAQQGLLLWDKQFWEAYLSKVSFGGGEIDSDSDTKYLFRTLPQQENIKFGWVAGMGKKLVTTAGVERFNSIYSMYGNSALGENANEPVHYGDQGENAIIKNSYGSDTKFIHDTFSFAASDKWSMTAVVNDSWGPTGTHNGAFAGYSPSYIALNNNRNPEVLRFYSAGAAIATFNKKNHLGKNTIIQLIADGSGNLKLFINGDLIEEKTGLDTAFNFRYLVDGYATRQLWGTMSAFILRDEILTDSLAMRESGILRNVIPEIFSTNISGQIWDKNNFDIARCSFGDIIAHVTDAATWATATTLYTNAYNGATGTEEEKIYAGVKAAAMWCYYDNDILNGALYNKLYNWYAVKLIQMNFYYYNTLYPETNWGWHVPSEAEWNILQSNATADSLKHSGEKYWGVGNTGTNTTGFTSLPGGYRDVDGTFYELGESAGYWNIDTPDVGMEMIGFSLRLIKD